MNKPFDLQKALAGDPVVTRNGIEVLEITYLATAINYSRVQASLNLGVSAGNNVQRYYENGRCDGDSRDSPYDLFMAPKPVTYYVNLMNTGLWYRYLSLEEAKKSVNRLSTKCTAVGVPISVLE